MKNKRWRGDKMMKRKTAYQKLLIADLLHSINYPSAWGQAFVTVRRLNQTSPSWGQNPSSSARPSAVEIDHPSIHPSIRAQNQLRTYKSKVSNSFSPPLMIAYFYLFIFQCSHHVTPFCSCGCRLCWDIVGIPGSPMSDDLQFKGAFLRVKTGFWSKAEVGKVLGKVPSSQWQKYMSCVME